MYYISYTEGQIHISADAICTLNSQDTLQRCVWVTPWIDYQELFPSTMIPLPLKRHQSNMMTTSLSSYKLPERMA